jgi:hypothetical protein
VNGIVDYLINQQGFTTYEAAAIIVSAPLSMCPDVEWRVQDYINKQGQHAASAAVRAVSVHDRGPTTGLRRRLVLDVSQ